jgi:hypothetical protein
VAVVETAADGIATEADAAIEAATATATEVLARTEARATAAVRTTDP